MPNLTSVQTNLRASGHHVRGYLQFIKGRELASGMVLLTDEIVGYENLTTVNIISTIGTFDATLYDATVYFFDGTSGKAKGTTRVARQGVPTSSVFYIPETAQGALQVESGDTFEIWDERRIDMRIPSESLAFNPDNEVWDNDTQNLPPVVVSHGPYAAHVDAGESYATFDFDGSDSYATDPANVSGLTHAWAFGSDATPTTSTNESPTGVQIPAGTRWVRHAVTDADSGAVAVQWVPVAVADDSSNAPYEVQVTGMRGNPDGGWEFTFNSVRGAESVDLSTVPDGAAVVFWVDEEPGSYGAAHDNSHVKFFGYLSLDSEVITATDDVVSFTAISPIARLQRLPGFGHVIIAAVTATSWQTMKNLTVYRAITHVLRHYTTALSVCDIFNDYVPDVPYPAFFVQKQNPIAQVRDLAESVDGRMIADRRGAFRLSYFPPYIPYGERSGETVVLTLTPEDVVSLTINREHERKVSTVEFRGFTVGDSIPVFALWPSSAPAGGTIAQTVEKMIALSQSDLEDRGGRRGAWLDRVIVNEDTGERVNSITLNLTLPGAYDVFDFQNELIKVDDFTLRRGIDLGDYLFFVTNIEVTYDGGTALTTLTLEALTNAPPAQYYVPPPSQTGVTTPIESPADFGSWNLNPGLIPTPPPSPEGLTPITTPGVGAVAMSVLLADGKAYRTANGNTDNPTWVLANDTGVDDILYSEADPYVAGAGWAVTLTNIYRVTNMGSGTATASSVHTFANTIETAYVVVSRHAQNYVAVITYEGDSGASSGVHVYRATDGATFTDLTLTEDFDFGFESLDNTLYPGAFFDRTGTLHVAKFDFQSDIWRPGAGPGLPTGYTLSVPSEAGGSGSPAYDSSEGWVEGDGTGSSTGTGLVINLPMAGDLTFVEALFSVTGTREDTGVAVAAAIDLDGSEEATADDDDSAAVLYVSWSGTQTITTDVDVTGYALSNTQGDGAYCRLVYLKYNLDGADYTFFRGIGGSVVSIETDLDETRFRNSFAAPINRGVLIEAMAHSLGESSVSPVYSIVRQGESQSDYERGLYRALSNGSYQDVTPIENVTERRGSMGKPGSIAVSRSNSNSVAVADVLYPATVFDDDDESNEWEYTVDLTTGLGQWIINLGTYTAGLGIVGVAGNGYHHVTETGTHWAHRSQLQFVISSTATITQVAVTYAADRDGAPADGGIGSEVKVFGTTVGQTSGKGHGTHTDTYNIDQTGNGIIDVYTAYGYRGAGSPYPETITMEMKSVTVRGTGTVNPFTGGPTVSIYRALMSLNGGQTWNVVQETNDPDLRLMRVTVAGDKSLFAWGKGGGVYHSPDGGLTNYDRSGNLPDTEIVGLWGT